jgi:UDP-N-acetylmuramyl pentapeptide phosphotransferase/UDP-N-acetylglucosamine-1-phosphate transferase
LGEDMIPFWLLFIFAACVIASMLLCAVAMKLFPRFRSGEFKRGPHRSDLPEGGREIKIIELPLVGGPAFTLALIVTGIAAGYLLNLNFDQWKLLLIGLAATASYMIIGFVDDWHKVYSKEGIRERDKFIGVMAVSIGAAFLYFWLLPAGRQPYSPYSQLPIIGSLVNLVIINHIDYAWLLFLMLMTGIIGTVTSLSVDFSDGLDGLAGGLVFSAALAFGIIVTGIIDPSHPEGIVVELLCLLCAGSVLGFLPWNWPSSWAARKSTARRRAKIYMGDSGALALGGLLAMIAIFSRQEILLLMVGGAFVLEGLSALISARILTPFFRKRLQLLRYASMSDVHVPHTEFPRPFLATPLHHHFDLLGWDRRRLVYGAWALGACFAILGVLIGIAPFTWQRYLARIAVLIVAWIVWSSGSWTRRYFIGKYPANRSRRRRLALFYGFPYSIMGINLFHLVEVIAEASEDVIETPAEEAVLWQRINIYDARALLGLFCYRAGYYPAAMAQWSRIPTDNLALRPNIAGLLAEVENRLALEQQETQPMRRDQILRQQEPIISGNLAPADLPNPYEPIRNEEKEGWMTGKLEDYNNDHNDSESEDDEEQQVTAPLRRNTLVPTNHVNNGHTTTSTELVTRDTATRKNWLARLIHPFPDRDR